MLGEQSITQLQKQPFSNMVTSLYLFTALQLTSLVRTHTKIPVPRVLTWSSDASNRTGTEYITMEKATGVQLFKVWGNTNELQRLRLIENITKIENRLSPIRFPAYRNLLFPSFYRWRLSPSLGSLHWPLGGNTLRGRTSRSPEKIVSRITWQSYLPAAHTQGQLLEELGIVKTTTIDVDPDSVDRSGDHRSPSLHFDKN